SRLRAGLRSMEGERDAERSRSAQLTTEVDAERSRSAQLTTEVDAERSRSAQLTTEVDAERIRCNELQFLVHTFADSRSWQLTAPLRAVGRQARRLARLLDHRKIPHQRQPPIAENAATGILEPSFLCDTNRKPVRRWF